MKHIRSLASTVSSRIAYASTYTYLQFHAVRAMAQGRFGGPTPTINDTPEPGIRDAVMTTLNFVLGFLALLAVVFIIIGGFRIVAAGGNEENVTKGRKTILYALIGLVVIFFANVIVGFITSELVDEF